ncbi:MAG: serine/threonine protein kinase [Gemmatimonadaceae bacterium]|nr:serine/threonine protein kinase [Gemmatimonadaceae bacterium]
MDAALQRIVGPAYRLERELPAGGMARVFVATEVALDRRVVIKVHTAAGGTDDARGQRFRREIQLAATLQHPAIVPLYAAGDGDGTLWYAMPFVEGASLRDRLEQGALPAAEAVRLWRDLLEALAHAHDRGVIHRDIKPENILLSGGRAVVTDFGVAKALDAAAREGSAGLTSVGIALGTPAYMAPEQALADPAADHRVDLYAAGLVAYEMLTGRMPFTGGSPQLLMAAHLTQAPPPLDGVASPLAALVLQCLAKDAAARPATARAAIEALDVAAAGMTPSGAMAGASPAPRAGGRGRRRARVVGAVVLLVAAAGAALWYARQRAIGARLALPGIALLGDVEHAAADSVEARVVAEGLERTLVGEGELVVPKPASVRGVGAMFGFDTTARVEAARMREIVQRTGVRAVILPRLVRDGAGYVIDVSVRGGVPDTLILQERERVGDASSIALATERLGRTARERLERISASLRLPPGIGFGRTRSTEAAKLQAAANAARNRGDRAEAIAQARGRRPDDDRGRLLAAAVRTRQHRARDGGVPQHDRAGPGTDVVVGGAQQPRPPALGGARVRRGGGGVRVGGVGRPPGTADECAGAREPDFGAAAGAADARDRLARRARLDVVAEHRDAVGRVRAAGRARRSRPASSAARAGGRRPEPVGGRAGAAAPTARVHRPERRSPRRRRTAGPGVRDRRGGRRCTAAADGARRPRLRAAAR